MNIFFIYQIKIHHCKNKTQHGYFFKITTRQRLSLRLEMNDDGNNIYILFIVLCIVQNTILISKN